MTLIKDLFAKQIDRKIDGVVKADDNAEATLRNEFEEYVITSEAENSLDELLDAYINDNAANQNGVWISGFFGSGKSHLLKMLAYLLENQPFSDGVTPLEIFTPKCGANADLAAKLARACQIPTQKIFFNIDQQAPTAGAAQRQDALVATFVKMFDIACGYYGNQPYIAQFERNLDKDGKLEAFRMAFAEFAGKPWEKLRETPLVAEVNATRAFDKVYGYPEGTSKGVLSKSRQDYRLSIEDFAREVKAYLDTKPKDFRLNFYVDEVGQFIATNVARMTNLQTIAESLATICKRRAWVFVTSQQDMTHVIGEFDKEQGNDFSKIQARFNNRISLSSKNVDEVIRRRLLAKSEKYASELAALYAEHAANIKTLFEFTDNSARYKHYTGVEDFTGFYPFVPYQFSLFQLAIEQLSAKNVFEGRHNSVGERSMLGVFQEVAEKLCAAHATVGALAPFDYMYEGIRQVVKSTVVSSIHVAEKNLGDEFAVRVLKVLFLVKYVKLFKASKRNLAILLRKDFGDNALELESKVSVALENLERQSYIQRTGEYYEYLTDAEQDIEKEIKSLGVDHSEIRKELSSILFKSVMRNPKIHYEPNGEDYTLGRKIDGQCDGPEKPLSINFLSPWYNGSDNGVTMLSIHNNYDLIVQMKVNPKFMDELTLWIKTNKYVSQNVGLAEHQGIISNKRELNFKRLQNLERTAQEMITEGALYLQGTRLPDMAPSTSAQARITEGCVQLIESAYTNLKMSEGLPRDVAAIEKALQKDPTLFENDPLGEAEGEVLNKIKFNQREHITTTIKNLLDHFTQIPYGWGETTILYLAVNLLARGTVNISLDGATLAGREAAVALKNSRKHANIVLTPQAQYSEKQLKRVKEFCKDFGYPASNTSIPRDLVEDVRKAVADKLSKLDAVSCDLQRYPFLSAAEKPREKLVAFRNQTDEWYFGADFQDAADEVLNVTESTLDRLLSFMNGGQRKIYDVAHELLAKNRENIEYKDAVALKSCATQIESLLRDPEIYLNRNNVISTLKDQSEAFAAGMDGVIRSSRSAASQKITADAELLYASSDFQKLTPENQTHYRTQVETKAREIEMQESLGIIQAKLEGFNQWLSKTQREIYALAHAPDPATPQKPVREVVRVKRPAFRYAKAVLETTEDIDAFVASYQEAVADMADQLKRQIAEGKAVQWENV